MSFHLSMTALLGSTTALLGLLSFFFEDAEAGLLVASLSLALSSLGPLPAHVCVCVCDLLPFPSIFLLVFSSDPLIFSLMSTAWVGEFSTAFAGTILRRGNVVMERLRVYRLSRLTAIQCSREVTGTTNPPTLHPLFLGLSSGSQHGARRNYGGDIANGKHRHGGQALSQGATHLLPLPTFWCFECQSQRSRSHHPTPHTPHSLLPFRPVTR